MLWLFEIFKPPKLTENRSLEISLSKTVVVVYQILDNSSDHKHGFPFQLNPIKSINIVFIDNVEGGTRNVNLLTQERHQSNNSNLDDVIYSM